jgi:hypothetical protein
MEYTSVTSFCYEFNVPKVVINLTKGVTVDVEINASGIGEYRVPVREIFVGAARDHVSRSSVARRAY